ncbi:MAG: transposase [Proteobacteria bacterium]|nr:transposase [Pseudomonadota bacterium]
MADQPLHVIQRGNNKSRIFFTRDDATSFLGWLGDAAERYGLSIHAYVLMPNHIHLLASPQDAESLPRTMQSVGRRYVRYLNRRIERSGTLWEGRYRATIVDTDAYFLRVARYIELNPVRAALSPDPAAYRWSSHRANALGNADPLVTPHALYLSLGPDATARAESYAALFAAPLSDDVLAAIRGATNRGWALGDEAFQERMSAAGGRRAKPRAKGRTRANADAPPSGPSPDFLAG